VSALPYKDFEAMADVLANWPANSKPSMSRALQWLIAYGMVKEEVTAKPCKTCGTARPDYSYLTITLAGKAFLAAMTAHPMTSEGK